MKPKSMFLNTRKMKRVSSMLKGYWSKRTSFNGLDVMGATGKNPHMTCQEKFSIILEIHNELTDFILIGGIAQNSVEDTIDEINSVKKSVAKYAAVLPSNYFEA